VSTHGIGLFVQIFGCRRTPIFRPLSRIHLEKGERIQKIVITHSLVSFSHTKYSGASRACDELGRGKGMDDGIFEFGEGFWNSFLCL